MDVYKITVSFDGNRNEHQIFVQSYLDRINNLSVENKYSARIDRSFISVIMGEVLNKEEEQTIRNLILHLHPEILTRKYTLTNMVRMN